MNALLTIVPVMPLLAAVLILFIGSKLLKRGAWLAVAGTAGSLTALLALPHSGVATQTPWIAFADFTLTIGLRVDPLAWWMAVLVASIAMIVNVYASEFMASETEGRPRFHAFMALFAAAMLTVVLANSFVIFFAAWEVMGVCSWGLIGFWYRDGRARRSAQMAFLMTRIGDMGLLLAWLLVLGKLGTVEMDGFLSAVTGGRFTAGFLTLVALLFFTAAIGKSAQLPLTAWLPEAMVGPAPVSALIHSATMVAAGVYLVLRLYPLFHAAPYALTVVLWVGAITAVSAALVATSQLDLKRILAWSTVSQLGEMMISLGLLAPAGALFLLTTQAVFKSGLFLAAGAIERATEAHNLDQMGGLTRRLPWMGAAFAACGLALAGFPFFSGYWSDEQLLAAAVRSGPGWGSVTLVLIFLAGVYISRAGAGVFLPWRASRRPGIQKTGPLVVSVTVVLAAGAVMTGFLLRDTSASKPRWQWTVAAVVASVLGLIFGTWRVLASGPVAAFGRFPDAFASALFKLSLLPARAVAFTGSNLLPEGLLDGGARGIANVMNRVAYVVDRAEIRGFDRGAFGIASGIWAGGARVRRLETGKVYLYTGGVFVWLALMMIVFAAIWH